MQDLFARLDQFDDTFRYLSADVLLQMIEDLFEIAVATMLQTDLEPLIVLELRVAQLLDMSRTEAQRLDIRRPRRDRVCKCRLLCWTEYVQASALAFGPCKLGWLNRLQVVSCAGISESRVSTNLRLDSDRCRDNTRAFISHAHSVHSDSMLLV